MTPGRYLAIAGAIALAAVVAVLLFPSLLGSGSQSIPVTHDPVIINAVNGRQSGLREMGTAVKNIDETISAGLTFDVELLADVQNLDVNSDQMPFWFPAGSGVESGMETDALAEIWRSRDNFDRLASLLVSEVKALEDYASQRSNAGFLGQFEKVTAVCDECHKTYRAEQD